VILIEATGLGGPKLRVVLLPGLLAAGIGTLVSLGIGSISGLSTAACALGRLSLQSLGRPTVAEFGWTITLAIVVALLASLVMRGGKLTYRLVSSRQPLMLLPVIALIIAGRAIGFSEASGKGIDNVIFDGQNQLPGLVTQASSWSLGTMALPILCKGLAYLLSLGSFRGGPTFPLSAVVIATLLTTQAGNGVEPLIIVGVVVAYVVTLLLSRPTLLTSEEPASPTREPTPAPTAIPAPAPTS
jgi:hypothetical protein